MIRRIPGFLLAAIAAVSLTSQAHAAPVAYWSFDGIPVDLVSGSIGTLNGGAGYSFTTVAPVPNNLGSLQLDGNAGSFFSVAPPPGSVGGNFTVSAWANIASNAHPNNILSTRAPGETSFDMKLLNGNQVHGDIGNGAGTWGVTNADYNAPYNNNQWYHIAYVVNNANWKVYVNGTQAATGSYGSEIRPFLWDSSRTISIGRYDGSAASNEALNGFIDEVAVYNQALAPSQITALATGTSPLAIAGGRKAGAMELIPFANDADSDISSLKTYTHAIDFGSTPAPTINGVAFTQVAAPGVFPGGSTNIPSTHPGNAGHNTTGSIAGMMEDMVYGNGQSQIVLNGLTVGQSYDTRLYMRQWGVGDRKNMLEFDIDNDGSPERSIRINEDKAIQSGFSADNQAYMVSYTFVAEATSMTIRANQMVGNPDTLHLYGLTNEVTSRKPIESLFSTGLDAFGGALVGGSPDPHYSLVSAPQGTQALAILNHSAWAANEASSGWIGVADPGTTNVAVGDYRFRTSFDLTGFDPSSAEVNMTIFVDNRVSDVLLNGVSTGISLIYPGVGDQTFTPGGSKHFQLSSGFIPGLNTIEFVLNNEGTDVNPGGLRVDISGTAEAVPEPSTLALALAAGGLGLIGLRRRSAKSVA
jgi:hypothetical protein